ncbi:aminodeoxychorismate synthase component I [Pseudonocardia sp. TMWB2A]|uniref:aminodeoxychorismate synthase component I n=1 Tax=Pseudonocardia sp. TMWB2A TaxID=687430 RepID=UPI00307E7F43
MARTLLAANHPYVLLDDAREGDAVPARLFYAPEQIEIARTTQEVRALVDWMDKEARQGALLAGYLAYDAAGAFEPRVDSVDTEAPPSALPLGWFARFADMERIAADDVPALLPDPAGAWASAAEPRISRAAYDRALERILAYIHAGDIYQANFTFMSVVRFGGHPLALYARLRERQCAGYGGIIFTGAHWILSFSPELFFSQRGRSLMARPMKGTALRDPDPVRDAAQAAQLASDPKQRAENLMIVDLIRNDLSRVAKPGSVRVPDLFHVEQYPTVHQMISSVEAQLSDGHNAVDVLRQAFPCGSITGAPKIRAMEIIAATESAPRALYTGSIGYIAGMAEAAFNVAIRTLLIEKDSHYAALGLGSGIVADSRKSAEWAECLAKGRFVESAPRFDLIETMAFDPNEGIARLERHLARLKASSEELGFAFDRHAARNELQAATFRLRAPAKIRMLLSRRGSISIETGPMPDASKAPVKVALAPLPVDPSDWRLRHKSTERGFYDQARLDSGAFEVVFVAPDGSLTEGSFTSLFVERDGILLTPPVTQGLLPGVLRSDLLEEGRAVEATLTADDLKDGFYIGNSVRGLMQAGLG